MYFRDIFLYSIPIFPAVIWYEPQDNGISFPFRSIVLRNLFLTNVTTGCMPISQFNTLGWFAVGCGLVLQCHQCEA